VRVGREEGENGREEVVLVVLLLGEVVVLKRVLVVDVYVLVFDSMSFLLCFHQLVVCVVVLFGFGCV